MKVLVLGGQGFIGHNLCIKLKKQNHEVVVFSNNIDEDRLIDDIVYIQGDFTKLENYSRMFDNVDIVYHLISTTNATNSNSNMIFDIESNVINTIKLLDIIKNKNIKKIIFTSSGGTVYGIPENIPINETDKNYPICSYGITKLMIEKYLHLYNYLYKLDYQILRVANPYGPFHISGNQGLINVYLNQLYNGQTLEVWGDGSVGRDYIYIDDLTEAMYLAMITPTIEKILNIGSGDVTTVNNVLDIIKSTISKEVIVEYKNSRSIDVPINVLDITKAKKELGWEPRIGLQEGIKLTYNDIFMNEINNHKIKKN